MIALTFDDGLTAAALDGLLETLPVWDVRATFELLRLRREPPR